MKQLKLTKLIASVLVVGSVLALNPIGASAEWKQNNKGYWYTEGSSWVTGWRLIEGNWYYFYSDGYMAHDTTVDGYYLNGSGAWITNVSVQQSDDPFADWGNKDVQAGHNPEAAKRMAEQNGF